MKIMPFFLLVNFALAGASLASQCTISNCIACVSGDSVCDQCAEGYKKTSFTGNTGDTQEICLPSQSINIGKSIAIVAGCCILTGALLWIILYSFWKKKVKSKKTKLKKSIDMNVSNCNMGKKAILTKGTSKKVLSKYQQEGDTELGLQTTERHLIHQSGNLHNSGISARNGNNLERPNYILGSKRKMTQLNNPDLNTQTRYVNNHRIKRHRKYKKMQGLQHTKQRILRQMSPEQFRKVKTAYATPTKRLKPHQIDQQKELSTGSSTKNNTHMSFTPGRVSNFVRKAMMKAYKDSKKDSTGSNKNQYLNQYDELLEYSDNELCNGKYPGFRGKENANPNNPNEYMLYKRKEITPANSEYLDQIPTKQKVFCPKSGKKVVKTNSPTNLNNYSSQDKNNLNKPILMNNDAHFNSEEIRFNSQSNSNEMYLGQAQFVTSEPQNVEVVTKNSQMSGNLNSNLSLNHLKFKKLRSKHNSSSKKVQSQRSSPGSITKSQFIKQKIQQMDKDLKAKGFKDFEIVYEGTQDGVVKIRQVHSPKNIKVVKSYKHSPSNKDINQQQLQSQKNLLDRYDSPRFGQKSQLAEEIKVNGFAQRLETKEKQINHLRSQKNRVREKNKLEQGLLNAQRSSPQEGGAHCEEMMESFKFQLSPKIDYHKPKGSMKSFHENESYIHNPEKVRTIGVSQTAFQNIQQAAIEPHNAQQVPEIEESVLEKATQDSQQSDDQDENDKHLENHNYQTMYFSNPKRISFGDKPKIIIQRHEQIESESQQPQLLQVNFENLEDTNHQFEKDFMEGGGGMGFSGTESFEFQSMDKNEVHFLKNMIHQHKMSQNGNYPEFGQQYESEYQEGSMEGEENLQSDSEDELGKSTQQFRQISASQVNKKKLQTIKNSSGRQIIQARKYELNPVKEITEQTAPLQATRMRSNKKAKQIHRTSEVEEIFQARRVIKRKKVIEKKEELVPVRQIQNMIESNTRNKFNRNFSEQSKKKATQIVHKLPTNEPLNFQMVQNGSHNQQILIKKPYTPSTHNTLNSSPRTTRTNPRTSAFSLSNTVNKPVKQIPTKQLSHPSKLNMRTTYQSSNTRLSANSGGNSATQSLTKNQSFRSQRGHKQMQRCYQLKDGQPPHRKNSPENFISRKVIQRNTAPSDIKNKVIQVPSSRNSSTAHLPMRQFYNERNTVEDTNRNLNSGYVSPESERTINPISRRSVRSTSQGHYPLKPYQKTKYSSTEQKLIQVQNNAVGRKRIIRYVKSPSPRSTHAVEQIEKPQLKGHNEDSQSPSYVSPARSGTSVSVRTSNNTTNYVLRRIDPDSQDGDFKITSPLQEGWQSPPNLPRKYTFSAQQNKVSVLRSPELKKSPSRNPPRSPQHHRAYERDFSPEEFIKGSIKYHKNVTNRNSHRTKSSNKKRPPLPQSSKKKKKKAVPIQNYGHRVIKKQGKKIQIDDSIETSDDFNSKKVYTPIMKITEEADYRKMMMRGRPIPQMMQQSKDNFMESDTSILHSTQSINDEYYEMPYFTSMYDNQKLNQDVLSEEAESNKVSPRNSHGSQFSTQPVYFNQQPQEPTPLKHFTEHLPQKETAIIGDLPLIEERPEHEEVTMSNISRLSKLHSRQASGKINRYNF